MIGAFFARVLSDSLLLATVGGIILGGVSAEGLLLASAGDTFLSRVLAEGLLLGTAGGIFLVVEVVLVGTPVMAFILSSSSSSSSSWESGGMSVGHLGGRCWEAWHWQLLPLTRCSH